MSDWDNYLNPHEQEEFECSECGKPMARDTGVCSGICFEASML